MQQPPRILQYLTFPVLLILPVIALLALQSRATEKQRARQPAGAPGPAADDSPAFTGFPYIRVPREDLLNGQALNTFAGLVKQLESERGRNHPDTLIARNNHANALLAEGRLADAEAAHRELLRDMQGSLTPDHPDVFRCRFNIALNLRMQGRSGAALSEMEAVYEGWRAVLGEGHPRTQEALLVLEKLKPRL